MYDALLSDFRCDILNIERDKSNKHAFFQVKKLIMLIQFLITNPKTQNNETDRTHFIPTWIVNY
jgi:hypothetical protein